MKLKIKKSIKKNALQLKKTPENKQNASKFRKYLHQFDNTHAQQKLRKMLQTDIKQPNGETDCKLHRLQHIWTF